MAKLFVRGGLPLNGRIIVSGNKNAALPMIAALLLTDEECELTNVPDILDVRTMLDIAGELGAEFSFIGNTLRWRCPKIRTATISSELCARNRTSILFTASLLARCGRAELFPPGGDGIGRRRLDGHFYGLKTLGARMDEDPAVYRFDAPQGLKGRELFLDEASVTATEQILIAAVTAAGTTILYNAACEPHVQDLAAMLNQMGADISGAGTNTITVNGVEKLHGCRHRVTEDHIEGGSFLCLAAAAGGEVTLQGIVPRHYWMLRRVFEKMSLTMTIDPEKGEIFFPGGQEARVKSDFGGYIPQIADGTWPQYPSDMMSCTIVAATQCAGTTMFFEKMFESRLYFADRLIAMGANIIVCDPHRAVVTGRSPLHGLALSSPDIRAGMAMVIAALCARGDSVIDRAEMIYRGYEKLAEKLRSLGAKVEEQ